MAALLCNRFINVEKESFQSRLSKLLPLIEEQFTNSNSETAGKFVLLSKNDEEFDQDKENVVDAKVQAKDHQTIQTLKMLVNMCENCPGFLKSPKYNAYVDEIAQQAQKLLAYPHAWARFESAKILEHVLSSLKVSDIQKSFVNDGMDFERGFLYYNTHDSLKSLILDMCVQMIPGEISSDFAEQIVKNLIYIVNIIKDLRILNVDFKDKDGDSVQTSKKTVNLHWLIRRMRYVVNAEVAKTPSSIVLVSMSKLNVPKLFLDILYSVFFLPLENCSI